MSKLRLYGSTSGYNELTVPAVADNSELNIGNLAGNAYVTGTFSSNAYVTGTFSSNTYVQDALGSAGVPSGTKQIFVQTAAPTGWTKDTTHNDKALRVVSGTASNGGVDSFTTTFGAGKTTASHTLSTPQIPVHDHPYTTKAAGSQGAPSFQGPSLFQGPDTPSVTGSTGGGGSHSHPFSGSLASATADVSVTVPAANVKYANVIVAAKD